MFALKPKTNPTNIYLLKVNNRYTRKRCSKLTIKHENDVDDIVEVLVFSVYHSPLNETSEHLFYYYVVSLYLVLNSIHTFSFKYR